MNKCSSGQVLVHLDLALLQYGIKRFDFVLNIT